MLTRTCSLPSPASEEGRLSKLQITSQCEQCQEKDLYGGTQSGGEGRLHERCKCF